LGFGLFMYVALSTAFFVAGWGEKWLRKSEQHYKWKLRV
jgi:hypothetical protein